DVALVHESERAWAAAALMRDRNVGFLPVCDQDGRVIGTITDRDIAVRVVADGVSSDRNVGEVMTAAVFSVHPDDDLARAEQLMEAEHVSRIVVVDGDGKLAGVISLSDVADRERVERAGEVFTEVAARETRI